MAKRQETSFVDFDEMDMRGKAPDRKGRSKQTVENFIHDWQKFEDWDDVEIETFQRFNKRGNR